MNIPLITHTAKLKTGETVYALDADHPGVQEAVATTGDMQVCPLCMFFKEEVGCKGTPCYEESMMEDRANRNSLVDVSTITLTEGTTAGGYRSIIWVKDLSHVAMIRLGVLPPKE